MKKILSYLSCSIIFASFSAYAQDSTTINTFVPAAPTQLTTGRIVSSSTLSPNNRPWICTTYTLANKSDPNYQNVAIYYSAVDDSRIVMPSKKIAGGYADYYNCVKN